MLEIMVCGDDRCMRNLAEVAHSFDKKSLGPDEIYAALSIMVKEEGLENEVKIIPSHCMWGCSIGPTVVVRNEAKGMEEKRYGRRQYSGPITFHDHVEIASMADLNSLRDLIYDNLPETPK